MITHGAPEITAGLRSDHVTVTPTSHRSGGLVGRRFLASELTVGSPGVNKQRLKTFIEEKKEQAPESVAATADGRVPIMEEVMRQMVSYLCPRAALVRAVCRHGSVPK